MSENSAETESLLREILELHFDPEEGAPYWIERGAALGFDPREEVRTLDDLVRLGPFDEEALRTRPICDFLPRALRENPEGLIFGDTSGTTGPPKRAVFSPEDFRVAFVDSFAPTAVPLGFPGGTAWLFVGPSGPHPIGRAARELPRAMGGPEPFCVDFDPRWARKLPEGSFARKRYMAHLLEQAGWIVEREEIGVLFSTPPVLLGLAERMPQERRLAIGGVHFGGMELGAEVRARIAEAFPNAVLLSGYGNSLLGVSLEVEVGGEHADYFPWRSRLVLRVVREDGGLDETVPCGECGRVVATRLDRSMFLPNLVERDLAKRIPASHRARELGCTGDGLRDPHPPRASAPPRTGFY
jgi:acyl-CoA synthetase (AMP-forming)/AMP-acid ligase II